MTSYLHKYNLYEFYAKKYARSPENLREGLIEKGVENHSDNLSRVQHGKPEPDGGIHLRVGRGQALTPGQTERALTVWARDGFFDKREPARGETILRRVPKNRLNFILSTIPGLVLMEIRLGFTKPLLILETAKSFLLIRGR